MVGRWLVALVDGKMADDSGGERMEMRMLPDTSSTLNVAIPMVAERRHKQHARHVLWQTQTYTLNWCETLTALICNHAEFSRYLFLCASMLARANRS